MSNAFIKMLHVSRLHEMLCRVHGILCRDSKWCARDINVCIVCRAHEICLAQDIPFLGEKNECPKYTAVVLSFNCIPVSKKESLKPDHIPFADNI